MSTSRTSAHAATWHAEPADGVLAALETGGEGLSDAEAAARLDRYGPNRLPPPRRRGPVARFLAQFHNVLIYVLLGAAAMTALLEHWVDTGVILGVVVVNAIIGFVQEGKAESALEAIRHMLAPSAIVIRDGRRVSVPAETIVPGDLVVLQSGDRVPADLRLTRVKTLQVQEAALTGESVPVEKAAAPVAAETALGDRASMAYSGTLVTYGQATGVVVATGEATEIGRISAMLGRVETLATPLLSRLAEFSRVLTVAILGFAAATFAFGTLVRSYGATEMFMAAVGLAVAAIPEGLPAIMTITLAIGVQRMAGRNAIIRRLPAVETLGSVTVICSDKTGTLTRNEMTVQSIATARHLYEVTGAGYAPTGAFWLGDAEVQPAERPLLREMTHGALLCSDARLRHADDGWLVEGDPTEGALVSVAMKAGWDPSFEDRAWPRTDVIPFESEHRFMASLNHDHAGNAAFYVKGAPERLLGMCAAQRGEEGDEPLDVDYWHGCMEAIAGRGQRLLALARKPVPPEHRELTFADVESGLVLLGLFGLADPPREEAITAIAACRRAGIRPKMITGDHGATARAIAVQLGLVNDRDVVTGTDLETIEDGELRHLASQIDVFARASPEHKLRLVEALQAEGAVVAMTGDGVNDAPALKRADVGIAMGQKGTEAAKEAAEMVLADDNFASIAHAVEEGRTVYDNLKKAVLFLLPVNGGESLALITAILLGTALPVTPLQILWINMVSSVGLAIALAFEPTEPGVMARPPRRPDEPVLSPFLVWRVAFVSVIFLAGIFGMFFLARRAGVPLEEARTLAVNTLVALEVFYLFNVRYLGMPSLTFQGILGTRAVLIALAVVTGLQFVFTYAPFMNLMFDSRALSIPQGLLVIAVGVAGFVVIEVEKILVLRHTGRHRPARA